MSSQLIKLDDFRAKKSQVPARDETLSVTEQLKNIAVFMNQQAPEAVVQDNSEVELTFNVMPNRPVKETLSIKEYRLWDRYAEATIDRNYFSSMEKSPNHLIFLTACAHFQKLCYVYLTHEFGFKYDPNGVEVLKIWPTQVDVNMPGMVRQNTNVIQKFAITRFQSVSEKVFEVDCITSFNDVVTIVAKTKVYLI